MKKSPITEFSDTYHYIFCEAPKQSSIICLLSYIG